MSLDRHSLKPLNLRGITNGNVECVAQPLLAIVDDRNNVKVFYITFFLFSNIVYCSSSLQSQVAV